MYHNIQFLFQNIVKILKSLSLQFHSFHLFFFVNLDQNLLMFLVQKNMLMDLGKFFHPKISYLQYLLHYHYFIRISYLYFYLLLLYMYLNLYLRNFYLLHLLLFLQNNLKILMNILQIYYKYHIYHRIIIHNFLIILLRRYILREFIIYVILVIYFSPIKFIHVIYCFPFFLFFLFSLFNIKSYI